MILPSPRPGMPPGGPAPADKPEAVPELRAAMGQFKRLTLLMRPFWGRLLKGIAAGGLIGILGMASPWVMKLLIDEVYPTRNVTLMNVLVGGSLALGASSMLMAGIQNYYNLSVNVLLNNSAGLLFFNHLQHLPMRFFEEHRVGELMARFGDVRRALQSVAKVFQTVLVQGVYLLLVPPFLFILQWKLALAALVSIPLTTTVIALTSRAMRKHWKRSAEAYGEMNAHQTETLTQIRTLKSMGLEKHTYQRTRGKLATAMELELRAGGMGQLVSTSNGLLNVANTALITWLGWRLILEGSMSLGDFMAFSAYLGYLYGPVNQFVGLLSEFQQSAVSLDRMFEYLDTKPEQDPGAAYQDTRPIAHRIHDGEVVLEDVSFSYAPGKEALSGVSLTLRPGQVTAVVGHSGSGKTSLLRLLTRLEEVGSGRILIDGVPISRIPLADLRRQVAVVWQEHSLLNGTVWENLTLGVDQPDPEEVYRACRVAEVHDVVSELARGYHTAVAEAGMSLSGGQRQRLAIARALVREAPVLLLDEATANVDMQTEGRILENLLAEYRDRTLVFVTHRVGMARMADQVCVMENAKLVATGTHEQLLLDCPVYQGLHGHQPAAAS